MRSEEPMTLLDLDNAGLDPAYPCPPEFMDFLYQNSQDGYITLWSHILAEPDGSSRIQKWIDEGVQAYHARTIQTQMAPPTPEKPEGENITEISYVAPPDPEAPIDARSRREYPKPPRE